MATCEATGPWAISWSAPSRVLARNVRKQVLRDALPDEEQADDDRQRQQDVEGGARQIDPEIADDAAFAPEEAADHRGPDGDAGRRRHEVLRRQPDHLAEIRHRRLAAIGLPVGVGDEAHRRVEGKVRRQRRQALRVPRQKILQPQHRVEQQEAGEVESEAGQRIARPVLLTIFSIDAGGAVKAALERAEDRRKHGPLVGEELCHVDAERPGKQAEEKPVDDELQDIGSHERRPSKALRPRQRVAEIDEEEDGDRSADDEVESHGALLDAFAEADGDSGGGEEARGQKDVEDVQHGGSFPIRNHRGRSDPRNIAIRKTGVAHKRGVNGLAEGCATPAGIPGDTGSSRSGLRSAPPRYGPSRAAVRRACICG